MKVLILGASGLLGRNIYKNFKRSNIDVFGTIRNMKSLEYFSEYEVSSLHSIQDITNEKILIDLIDETNPSVIINCISIENINNQENSALDLIFTKFPIMLSNICLNKGIKVIQISSDGVFSGLRGDYYENSIADATDAYGKAKLAGELTKNGNLTIRTSMIGHDPIKSSGLLEWFFSQKECVLFNKSIFSGLTVNEIADVIKFILIEHKSLSGLYHIASQPISKYHLLSKVSEIYKLRIKIEIDSSIEINRSLNSNKFQKISGYSAPSWNNMLFRMREDFLNYE